MADSMSAADLSVVSAASDADERSFAVIEIAKSSTVDNEWTPELMLSRGAELITARVSGGTLLA
jgi:hypothetical protein